MAKKDAEAMVRSTGSSLVQYERYTEEDAEKDMTDFESSRRSAFVKLEPGKTIVRFIPALPGKKWKRVTYIHYVDVPAQGRVSFVCPRLEAKRPCKVCKMEQKLLSSGNPLDEDKAKKLRAKRRCYANVIERGREEDGPRVLGFGPQIEEQLIELRREDGVDFIDPLKGCDIAILRKGTSQSDTRYKVKAGEVRPLHSSPEQINEWIQAQIDLEKYARVYSDEDIGKILRGERPSGEEGRDEYDTPVRPSRTAADEVDDPGGDYEIPFG
jgi:hypothetical protein